MRTVSAILLLTLLPVLGCTGREATAPNADSSSGTAETSRPTSDSADDATSAPVDAESSDPAADSVGDAMEGAGAVVDEVMSVPGEQPTPARMAAKLKRAQDLSGRESLLSETADVEYLMSPQSPPPSTAEPMPSLSAPQMQVEEEVEAQVHAARPGFNTEAYDQVQENPFHLTRQTPLSTFAIDVDTASYANMRRFISGGSLPPPDAVRIEELVNYFSYDYSGPDDQTPFSAHVELASCPWNPDHRLARVALKGREVDREKRPEANLVFLLDVSGSMGDANKLPLVRSAMKMLVNQLSDRDRIAIVVYAGASGLVLEPTSCEQKQTILDALDRLKSGGSTNGGAGIELAYNVIKQHQTDESIDRVILCTDGDFNVGTTDRGSLIRLIEERANEGAFLTVLGFGMGNYKDGTLEQLADKGNGNYGYIDTIHEARKLLVDQLAGTLVTIAKDVKIQVDFNPTHVAAYRLIGYENRLMRAEEFRDDAKDAGEIGAGHSVTALYELVPPGKEKGLALVADSKYQTPLVPSEAAQSKESLTLRLRYKQPNDEKTDEATELEFAIQDEGKSIKDASDDFRFATSVACFGMLLRGSEHAGNATHDLVIELAEDGKGEDRFGYRAEFLQLVRTAQSLTPK